MNGVKRFLEGAGLRTPSPPTPINTSMNVESLSSISVLISTKPSWSPFGASSLIESADRQNLNPLQSVDSPYRLSGSNFFSKHTNLCDDFSTLSGAKPSILQDGCAASSSSAELSETNLKEQNRLVDIQDELHMSLLASQAIVDSKDARILTTEEVEVLKKVGRYEKLIYTYVLNDSD